MHHITLFMLACLKLSVWLENDAVLESVPKSIAIVVQKDYLSELDQVYYFLIYKTLRLFTYKHHFTKHKHVYKHQSY